MLTTPPLLIGVTLVFWGVQTGLPLIGVLLGAMIEASRLVSRRIDFTFTDYNRIWDLSTSLVALGAMYCFVSRDTGNEIMSLLKSTNFTQRYSSVRQFSNAAVTFFQWWPMLVFPMMAAQAYGGKEVIPVTTYSYFARRRMRQAGKEPQARPGMNFGYIYFAICIFASSLTTQGHRYYYVAFVALVGCGLWQLRSRRFPFVAWAALMILLGWIGYIGQSQVPRVAAVLEGKLANWLQEVVNGRSSRMHDTEIGDIGETKGSGRIVMRVETGPGAPRLLRDSTYSRFNGRNWQTQKMNFVDLEPLPDGESWRLMSPDRDVVDQEMTIQAPMSGSFNHISKPSGCYLVEDLPMESVQVNGLGTMRGMGGPGFIIYRTLYNDAKTLDADPEEYEVLRPNGEASGVAPQDRQLYDDLLREIGVRSGESMERTVKRVSQYFESFEYRIYNDKPIRRGEESRIARFLKDRAGHCEYFATATVGLLQTAGVPARYALGWALIEEDERHNYVVRERHAHAWIRYWSPTDGKWHDLDTTPGSWVEIEESRAGWMEPVTDQWASFSHAFLRFRYYGDLGPVQNYLLIALVALVALLTYRLFFRKGRKRILLNGDEIEYVFERNGLDSDFYAVEIRLQAMGLVRHNGESLIEWHQRLTQRDDVQPDLLAEILDLHYRYRFDPEGLDNQERSRLRDFVAKWLERVGRSEPART
ncbi:MAG: hypothetical protein ACI9OD_003941 [Limisphaerales bacterium]|jgi:hypothetical protein